MGQVRGPDRPAWRLWIFGLLCLLLHATVTAESDPDLIFLDTKSSSAESNSLKPLLQAPSHHRKRAVGHQHARFFSDDEDDDNGFDDNGSGLKDDYEDEDLLTSHSGDGATDTSPQTPHAPAHSTPQETPPEPFVYFRVTLTLSNLPYEAAFANRSGDRFRRQADELVLSLDPLFQSLRGLQRTTVLDFRPWNSPEQTLVRLYVGSMGNKNERDVESVVQRVVQEGRIGRLRVDNQGYSFKHITNTNIPHCRDNQFICDSGECIEGSRACDRRPDCRDDSDEAECPLIPTTVITPSPSVPCGFQCHSNGGCINAHQRCDGRHDCPDGSDELYCRPTTTTCPNGMFLCDGSRCIEQTRRCDNRRDCADRTDEDNCTTATTAPPTCNIGQFRCQDGSCVPIQARCNGRMECPDNSDEKSCPCRPGQFQCDNGFCIDERRKCDGFNNCQDSSDEKNCPERCGLGQFQCKTGGCIPESGRCNLTYECRDGSDERDCPRVICRSDQFRCHDGICLNLGQRCDGTRDCSNGEDEDRCGQCSLTQYRCQDGTCVPATHRCNGRFECQDGSDERNCGQTTKAPCRPTDFVCSDGTCVNQTVKCGGLAHCPNREDEILCQYCQTASEFVCNSGQCIDKRRRCDGRSDCTNGEDEADCPLRPERIRCQPGDVVCRNGTCLPASKRCDGVRDCIYGIDEANCGCKANEFTCVDNSCVDRRRVCNGYPDCRDGSDEANCVTPTCRPSDFQCGDGSCVNISKKCDGNPDCRSGLDEVGCGCPSGQFQCDNRQCIPEVDRCNRRYDCLDASDEKNCDRIQCSPSEFRCGDGQCIEARRKCDRRYDCPDRSDELGCDHGCQHTWQFQCGSGDCVNTTQKCDGRFDCRDRSDEHDCRTCLPNQYYCANGQCVDRTQRCDGRFDCTDYSDESDCESNDGVNLKVYPERQTIRQGREVVFRCRDEGPRRAPVKWARPDNRPLPSGARDVRGRLTIPTIQPDQGGVYICAAVGVPPGLSGTQKAAFLTVQPYEQPTERPTRPSGVCARSEATCQNGECVPREYLCDGDYDCTDRSDETSCAYQTRCEPSEFQCENKKCVLKVWRCDGENDCGDNSDEKSCVPNSPGSPCRYDEFQCQSGDQCIPKSFQCDGEFDCQDKSDEIGCASPTITQPPPETLTVAEGDTVTIKCSAVGNPVPIINWRLNWGHIPPSPRVSVKSEAGHGSVTIREARTTDGGAWSCEAINSKNSILATPDCILIVKSKAGVCRPPMFNDQAESPTECLKCFCFGVTTNCYSSNLYNTNTTLQTDVNIRVLKKEPNGSYSDVGGQYPANQDAIQYLSASKEYTLDSDVRQGAPPGVYYYWSLPGPEFLGNQLNSYGGFMRYTFRYKAPHIQRPPRIADIILKGNELTLLHVLKQTHSPLRDTYVEVRLLEGEWTKSEHHRRGDSYPTEVTTREDMMMVLQSLDAVLIRASYDEELVESSLINFQLDTAILNDRLFGTANLVEKCSCPQGYDGNSCEMCAIDYTRRQTSAYLGECVPTTVPCKCHAHSDLCDPTSGECLNCQHNTEGRQCERCRRGFFGDARRGTTQDCQPCPCPLITSSNQFSPTCFLERDSQVTCDACPLGYEGRRCERCAPGYEGNPNIPGSTCQARGRVLCDSVGSLTQEPNPTTGLCQCKPYVTGARCDQCKANTYFLNSGSPSGCIDCFCMGITKACTSSTWYRDQVSLRFSTTPAGVSLSNLQRSRTIDRDLQIDARTRELVYRNFFNEPLQTYYWQLPTEFLGDKVVAYGGSLNYTVRYEPGRQASPTVEPDVELIGNGIILIYRHPERLRPSILQTINIPMFESSWLRSDGQPATREHLLMALADLSAILIKATYTTDTLASSLHSVSLEIAAEQPTGGKRAQAVEQCRCPIGYRGLSCEDCDAGYTRSGAGLYLGLCEPCFCNGHSSDCNPETGVCKNCQHNTAGDFCEECGPGFVGTASSGTPNDCKPATEPDCRCDTRGSLSTECDFRNNCRCKTNTQGKNCNVCKEGFFNLDNRHNEGCIQCFCFGVTQQCSSSSYFREQIHTDLQSLPDPYSHNFQLTNRYRSRTITDGIIVNPRQNEISFTSFPRDPAQAETLFWSLPAQFLGNKLASYGGKLSYSQSYSSASDGTLFDDADVEITGNGIAIFYVNSPSLKPQETQTFEIGLRETNWQRVDSRGPTAATREDLMKVLANVEALLVRASFHSRMEQTQLQNVRLDTARPQTNGQELAVDVEQCVCPPGYIGLSCEECAPGYIRDFTGPGLGRCTRCNCNGHSESCDATTGRCVRCRHNTMGDNCERCVEGFYGDAARGTPDDCKPCPCPLTLPSNQFSPTCFLDTDGQPTCNACPPGYSGRNCEMCATGFRGNPLQLQGRCESSGGHSQSIRVRVEEPRTHRVPVGATITFRCTGVSQVSDVTYTLVWTKEGGQFPSRATEASGVLTIPNVRPEDSGTYVCTGSDLRSVAQDRATLIVEGAGRPTSPRVRIEPHYLDVRVGEPVEFQCMAEGFPEPELQWTGGRQNQLPARATVADGIFRISAARKTDEAEYYCTARNSAGSESVRTVLFVTGEDPAGGEKPQVSISPLAYEARSGETVRFDCRVTGSPAPQITWAFSGGPLPQGNSQDGGLLLLTRVSIQHQGIYICTAGNLHGTSQQQARLSVGDGGRGPPVVRVEPERQTLIQGSSGEMRCVVSGSPAPIVTWSKVGGTLSARHKIQGESLSIDDVILEDRGLYLCRAENSDGTAQASSIVEVERREVPAIELYSESTQVVPRGGSAIFQCRVNAGVPSPTVDWTRADGSPFTSNTEILNGGIIRFNRVTGDEEGTYVCTAENVAGRVTAQATLRIEGSPTVRILQSSPFRVRPGEPVRLECRADGDPEPSLVWRKLQQTYTPAAAPPAVRTDGVATMEINRVSSSDSGTYICTARSSAGESEQSIQLIVEEIDSIVPEIVIEDSIVSVAAGDNVQMRCFIRGTNRDIYLKWSRTDGSPLPLSHGVEGGILHIFNAQSKDAGDYTCSGVLDGETILSTHARLAVVEPQSLRREETAYVGGSMELDCPVAVPPGPGVHYEWNKDGAPLPQNCQVVSNQLRIRNVQLENAGRYVCTATSRGSRSRDFVTLHVRASARPSCRSKEFQCSDGSCIEDRRRCDRYFDCPDYSDEAGCVTAPSSLHLDLHRQHRCPSSAFRCTSNGWCIDGRRRCDGRSDCEDRSDEDGCYRTRRRIRDVPTVEVRIEPSKEMVSMGDTLELRCRVTGDSTAPIQWSKVEHDGTLPDNVRIRKNILTINGVKAENGGVYRCTVGSHDSSLSDSYVLAIQVPPTFSAEEVETRTAPIDSTVVMDCQTTLDPPVAYTWSKQGRALPADATVAEAVLTIPNVKAQDAGTYICTAKSSVATMDIPTILVVTGAVPRFTQTPTSYMKMNTLGNAYLEFDLEVSFKPEQPNGLLLFNGQDKGGDFLGLNLVDSYVEFRFDLGNGPAILRSPKPVTLGAWHSAHITRDRKEGVLRVSGQEEVRAAAPGRFQGLDLTEPLYIGGVPDLALITKQAEATQGFVGCISKLKIRDSEVDLMRTAESYGTGPCEGCSENPCLHGGVCQEALTATGFLCLCPPGFSGEVCEKVGEACYAGVCGEGRCVNKPGGGFDCYCPFGRTGLRCEREIVIYEPAFSEDSYISYPKPELHRSMRFKMLVKPSDLDDGLLLYCAQSPDGQGDFTSIAIRNKTVEFRFDTGSGRLVLTSPEPIQADQWTSIVAERDMQHGNLTVNRSPVVSGYSPGHTRGLNLGIPLYVGGVDKYSITVNPNVEVTHGFDGCVSHVEVNDVKVDLVNSVIDAANVEDCGGRSPCDRRPCHNGGRCRVTGDRNAYACDCPEGFKGRHCEEEHDLCNLLQPCKQGGTCAGVRDTYKCHCPLRSAGTQCEKSETLKDAMSVQGDGFLSLDRNLLPHSSNSDPEEIRMSFQTTQSDGLLFFHGQRPETDGTGQDFMAVAIVGGYLEFSFDLGSGPGSIKTSGRVDDGRQHTITVKREGQEGSIEIDGIFDQYGGSKGILQIMNTLGDIYIGGVPDAERMTGNRYLSGFVGCIWDLKIQDSVIHFGRHSKEGRNVLSCHDTSAMNDLHLPTVN